MKWTHKEGLRKPNDISKYLNGFKLGEIKVIEVNGWHTRDQVLYIGYEPVAEKPRTKKKVTETKEVPAEDG